MQERIPTNVLSVVRALLARVLVFRFIRESIVVISLTHMTSDENFFRTER